MTIPTETLSGGKLSNYGGLKAARQFRIWVHPKKGDDRFYSYTPAKIKMAGGVSALKRAAKRMRATRRYHKVENPLAVVWDMKHQRYREVIIDV